MAADSLFPKDFFWLSIHYFTSASCVDEQVGILGNGCTLGPQSYPAFPRPNLLAASPGIHWRIRLAHGNADSDVCVQYALPDQDPEGAGSWFRIAHSLGRDKLTSASPFHGSGKAPLGGGALPVECHTEAISWADLSRRLRWFYNVPPGELID